MSNILIEIGYNTYLLPKATIKDVSTLFKLFEGVCKVTGPSHKLKIEDFAPFSVSMAERLEVPSVEEIRERESTEG